MTDQLILPIKLNDEATFDNLIVGNNQALIDSLQNNISINKGCSYYLWGDSGLGKTHILQASCHYLHSMDKNAWYISLSDLSLTPEILSDLPAMDLVCIDDIDAVCGQFNWEEKLFDFFNIMQERNLKMIFAGKYHIQNLNIRLKDLESRLKWGLQYTIYPLNDEEKSQAFLQRAKNKGLEITQEVVQFLLNRCSRNMRDLFDILEQLDKASYEKKRRITIPFIKDVLML